MCQLIKSKLIPKQWFGVVLAAVLYFGIVNKIMNETFGDSYPEYSPGTEWYQKTKHQERHQCAPDVIQGMACAYGVRPYTFFHSLHVGLYLKISIPVLNL